MGATSLLLLPFFVSFVSAAESNKFVDDSCKLTRYPDVCSASLSGSSAADFPHLAKDATDAALALIRDASAAVAKASKAGGSGDRTAAALKDCKGQLGNAEDLAEQTQAELVKLANEGGNSSKVGWHLSNAQTWMSATLSNEASCLDGFEKTFSSPGGGGGDAKAAGDVVKEVTFAQQSTSNALAIINHVQR